MSDSTSKPRVRVQAGSSGSGRQFTGDTFVNFAANLGYSTNNIASGGTYGFNPVSRNHLLLEWAYRGSWLVRKIVDCPADDMTREGIQIESDMPPDRIDSLTQYWNDLQLWQRMNSTLKWARLYGGAIGVLMIEGQKLDTPLRIDTVGKGQFKGLLVLDRWMLWPDMDDPVDDFGADFGLPKYYRVVADARSLPNMKIHHTRCLRIDGVELPYWQKIAENLWGLSVIEPLWDRIIAFDSATQGAAQLIYKSHLRVLKLADYRENIATMGKAHQAVLAQLNMIRLMQSNEGLTVLDKEDDFQANTYNFGGLSDMLVQFSQQVSGAADVPMTRLFGQSPAGMNATGESDLRNYYDGIKSQQEARLRRYITLLLHLTHRSLFGDPLPNGFNYSFSPLWQMTPTEKAGIANTIAGATQVLLENGVFSQKTAMKEIRQWSRATGFGSNITDEDMNSVPDTPPVPGMLPPGAPLGQSDPEAAVNQQVDLPHGAEAPEGPHWGADPNAEGDDRSGPGNAQVLAAPPGQIQAEKTALPTAKRLPQTPEQKFEAQFESRSNTNAEADWEKRFERMESQDTLPVVDVGPLRVFIETQKGESRVGPGWSVVMPCAYGYISGTSSAEGPQEQMDAFVGPDTTSEKVWVISQRDLGDGVFDEHKAMLGCGSRDEALALYYGAFSDNSGPERVGAVREMSLTTLHDWLMNNWQYGKTNGEMKHDRGQA